MRVLALRSIFAGLCLLGILSVLPVAIRQWTGETSCPGLGALPICYVILLAYSAMFISVGLRGTYQAILFVSGWIPVAGFAITGTVLELSGHETCPKAFADIPACVYSLGLSVLILVVALALRRHTRD
jgi:hypothetical protein